MISCPLTPGIDSSSSTRSMRSWPLSTISSAAAALEARDRVQTEVLQILRQRPCAGSVRRR